MNKEIENLMEEDLKKGFAEVYAFGFKNGQIEMRNKILKAINTDWSLMKNADLTIQLMKKINKIKFSKEIN